MSIIQIIIMIIEAVFYSILHYITVVLSVVIQMCTIPYLLGVGKKIDSFNYRDS